MTAASDLGQRGVGGLLPHTGHALLLTAIVRSETGFLEATGAVPSTHPLAGPDGAPCFLGLELGAQAAAALEALSRSSGDREPIGRVGYLVRVRDAKFLAPRLPTDTPLRVTARLEGAMPPLAVHRIEVSLDGVDLLTAVLGTISGER